MDGENVAQFIGRDLGSVGQYRQNITYHISVAQMWSRSIARYYL